MTKHDLKELAAMGAELGAAKAENEKLRGLLERIRTTCCQVRDAQDLDTAPGLSAAESLHEQIEKLDAALSPQAEPCGGCGNADESKRCIGCGHQFTPAPTDTFTAVDMATAAAQGFRDGQAAVEPIPVQDELEAVERFSPTTSVPHCGRASEVETYMTEDDDGEYMTVAQHERIVAALTRPAQTAQTEQQLAADLYEIGGKLLEIAHTKTKAVSTTLMAPHRGYTLKDARATALVMGERLVGMADRLGRAAPIAQTAPQPEQSGKFAMHQRVRKTSGSEWQGRICGTYSTELTPEGYAVESEAHAGSVQIYPAKALEAVE